jgi:hypothetical protein
MYALYERLLEPVYEDAPSMETVTPWSTLADIGRPHQPKW